MSRYICNLPRAIDIANYIKEDAGHSIAEAADEFGVSKETIRRNLNFLLLVAFDNYHPRTDLQKLHSDMKKTLKAVNSRNRKNKS